MTVAIVIPARFASTRYPGKPLVALTGAGGAKKTLIERSWRAASEVKGISRIAVATDDDRIGDAARAFGAEVIMTPETCRNGTERCAAALSAFPVEPEIIVNLQGDAPLTPPWFIEALVDALRANPKAAVATPVLRCDAETLRGLQQDRQAGRVGGTTAVFNRDGHALYFSKEVIPFTGPARTSPIPVFHHVGVYAYRPEALRAYLGWDEGVLEKSEGLEQLRFLENGVPVACVEVEAKGRAFWELNNPTDVARIEAILKAQGQQ